MKKIKWVFLCIILLSLTACSLNNIDKAQEYAKNGEFEKAEEIFLKFLNTDKAEEAYKGLFSIYIETDNIEYLRENLVAYNKLDLELENKDIYLKIFDYYAEKGDFDTINKMLTEDFSNVIMPEEIYLKYMIENKIPKEMDLVEIHIADLNNDNKNEIIITMGSNGNSFKDLIMYDEIKLLVLDPSGEIILEDSANDFEGVMPIVHILDFTGDGKLDLYFERLYKVKDLSMGLINVYEFEGSQYENLIEPGASTPHYFDIETLMDNQIKVFSQTAKISYIVESAEDIDPYDINIGKTGTSKFKITETEDGKAIIQDIWRIEDYAEIISEYEYIDGFLVQNKFTVEALNGNKIISEKKAGEYDTEKQAKNTIIGSWRLEEQVSEFVNVEYRIKVTDDRIITYAVNSEVIDDEQYEIVDYDEDNYLVKLKTEDGIYTYKVVHPVLEIVAYNGQTSYWVTTNY